MTLRRALGFLRREIERFRDDSSGATLVEFTLVLALFLLILFGIIDYGRLAFHVVSSEKAMHLATRIAVVRPPACAGVPTSNKRSSTVFADPPDFGSRCDGGVCSAAGPFMCAGDLTNATVAEIWPIVSPSLPNDAVPSDMRFTYAFDERLNFLGGPFVPVVTVELQDVEFRFVTPLSALASLAVGSTVTGLGGTVFLPSQSVSMPGEALGRVN